MAFETKMQLLLIGLLSLAYPLAYVMTLIIKDKVIDIEEPGQKSIKKHIDNKKLNIKKKDDTLSFSEDDFNLNDWDEILDKSFD
jgi:hypothetical protein